VQSKQHRIQYLDGLRGIAILFVIFFHAFSRWPKIVPYGDVYVQVPFFEYGWLGVQLFFMISGYVIFMSLQKSRNFQEFMIRRWIRLFPSMLICSLIIFTTASFFIERPEGTPVLRDLLPGLTFIEPYWWKVITGTPQGELEGAFWSLYVEIKLYLVAGIFYFLIGGQRMIWVLLGMFLVGTGMLFFDHVFVENGWDQAKVFLNALSGRPCGWFAAGALFYRYHDEGKKWLIVAAIITALASALAQGKEEWGQLLYNWDITFAGVIIVLLFTTASLNDRVKLVLSNRILLFVGFISYPLYLMHENMMVSLIVKFERFIPWMPSLLKPVLPVLFVMAVAWLVAKYLEPPIRRKLKTLHIKVQEQGWGKLLVAFKIK
jgi:peptidoglycan/LPS O-acetylase OafA/YrhL